MPALKFMSNNTTRHAFVRNCSGRVTGEFSVTTSVKKGRNRRRTASSTALLSSTTKRFPDCFTIFSDSYL